MNPVIFVGMGVVLFAVGIGVGYWVAYGRHKRTARKVDEVQNELNNYRQSVTDHFGETAQHFQALGQQYQTLYKHLAKGSDSLCDPARSDNLIGFAAADVPAIAADGEQERTPLPEVIEDAAAEEEIEPVQADVAAESESTAELAEEPPVPDVAPEEPVLEQALADQVAASTPDRAERTVH